MIVLITGAGRGIGRELARQYLAAGATVIATDRVVTPAMAKLSKAENLILQPLDVADPSRIEVVARELAARLSHVDVLFNNAGVTGQADGFDRLAADDLLNVFRINTLGPILVTRALLPLLTRARRARVLALTSRTGVLFENATAAPGGGYGYVASKAALARLLPLLAADLRPHGITAVGVDPGFVETDMTRGHAAGRHQLSPVTAVRGLRAVADALTPQHAGTLLRWNGARCRWLAPAETPEDRQSVPVGLPEHFQLANPASDGPNG